MAKALRKVIMIRSRLKNIYSKNQNTTNWNNYKYQQTVNLEKMNKILWESFDQSSTLTFHNTIVAVI